MSRQVANAEPVYLKGSVENRLQIGTNAENAQEMNLSQEILVWLLQHSKNASSSIHWQHILVHPVFNELLPVRIQGGI